MPQAPNQPAATQARIAELARLLADANPDAAEELARHLAYQAGQRKQARGFGIVLRLNRITERIEVQTLQ